MLFRFTLLFMLLQCQGPSKVAFEEPANLKATYMKYVPGAGGGRGILFKIKSQDSIPNLKVQQFKVNNIAVPAAVFYNQGGTVIEATMFYADPERSLQNENPEPVEPFLFNQEDFSASIYFTVNGEPDSLQISKFEELESPMYP